MIEQYTYGKSAAAINLTKMINEHPNSKIVARKVGRLLEHMNYAMNQLELLTDRALVERLHTLLLADIIANHMDFLAQDPTSEKFRIEENIRTHMINVLRGRYKSWYRGERQRIYRSQDVSENCTILRSPGGRWADSRVSVHLNINNSLSVKV